MADYRTKPSKYYTENVSHWKFLMDSYESGLTYIQGKYLLKHKREADEDFQNRFKRATPPGFARAVINTYKSLISRGQVSRDSANEDFNDFLEDADKQGRMLEKFIMELVFPVAQAVGWSWVLVDKPRVQEDEPVLTRADEDEQDLYPYCVHYDPTRIISWQYDGFGELEWVSLGIPATVDPETGKKVKPRVRVYDDEEWAEWEGNKQVDGATHNLGRVPFARLYNERSLFDPNEGLSAINNIAYINRDIFNLTSLLQEFLYKQCFNILVLDEDMLTEKGRAVIGTSNALAARAGGVLPQYVAPPSDPAQFLMDSIESDIARIYQEAGLIDRSAQQVQQAQSGISRAFEFHNTNTLLVSKSKELARFEMDIADIWFRWQQQDPDYSVVYPDDYDIRDLSLELDETERILKLSIASPTMKKIRAQRIANIIAPEADEEQKQLIKEEIEGAAFGSNETAQAGGPATGMPTLAARFAALRTPA